LTTTGATDSSSLLAITSGGIALFLMIALFDVMLVVGFGSAMLVARLRPPFIQA